MKRTLLLFILTAIALAGLSRKTAPINYVSADDSSHVSIKRPKVDTTPPTTLFTPTTAAERASRSHNHPSIVALTTTAPTTFPPAGEYSSAVASWYDLPGNTYANGEKYDSSLAFAHKTMAFGTRVEFCFAGRCAIGVCKDRGPFIKGRTFDLNLSLAEAIGLNGVQMVQYRTL